MNVPSIAFFNGKGGVGKTTGLINVAGVLSASGEKVLVIDMDKQRNASLILLQDEQSEYDERKSFTIFDVLMDRASLDEAVKKAYIVGRKQRKGHYCGIDVLAGDVRLEMQDKLKKKKPDIREELERFVGEQGYTYVLIDMPPSNEAVNTICFTQMANNIIVPFSPDIFSVSGFNDLMEVINSAREINNRLNIIGIYISRYRSRNYPIKEALKGFGNLFIDIQIPFSAQIEDTVLEGRPISYYKSNGKSLEAFEKLTEKIVFETMKMD